MIKGKYLQQHKYMGMGFYVCVFSLYMYIKCLLNKLYDIYVDKFSTAFKVKIFSFKPRSNNGNNIEHLLHNKRSVTRGLLDWNIISFNPLIWIRERTCEKLNEVKSLLLLSFWMIQSIHLSLIQSILIKT